jgi:tight adherence protein C
MLVLVLMCVYLCVFSFVVGLMPLQWEQRPTLNPLGLQKEEYFLSARRKKKKSPLAKMFKVLSVINKPFCTGNLRRRISQDLTIGHVDISPEEFLLFKEVSTVGILLISWPMVTPDFMFTWIAFGFVFGYMAPEFWLKGKVKQVKSVMVKELPDAIDLLGLCVNAGLDFMLSLKWVVEKSNPSVMVDELNTVIQEINVGKTRRDALKDLSNRYKLQDLSTFSRTLIQADKMGTSVTDALNILSEDMRLARYRRGEQLALKSPLKMLVPLLLFIFPVVGILVAGPILLDFVDNNPFSQQR